MNKSGSPERVNMQKKCGEFLEIPGGFIINWKFRGIDYKEIDILNMEDPIFLLEKSN